MLIFNVDNNSYLNILLEEAINNNIFVNDYINLYSLSESSGIKLKNISNFEINFSKLKIDAGLLLSSINASKTIKVSKLPKKECDDLIEVLNNMTVFCIEDFDQIILNYFTNCKYDTLSKKDKDKIDDDITRFIKIANDCINSYKNMNSYDRLIKNNYKKIDMIVIPLKEIEDIIIDTKNKIESIEMFLNRNAKNYSLGGNIINRIIYLSDLLLTIYSNKLNLLNIFINNAFKQINSLKKVYNYNLSINPDISKHKVTDIIVRCNKKEKDSIIKLVENMLHDNDLYKFNNYISNFKKLCNILKLNINNNITIYCLVEQFKNTLVKISDDDYQITIGYMEEVYTKINIFEKKLFHQSATSGLKEIKPSCIASKCTFLPEPRIYFHISFPLDRDSKAIKYNDGIIDDEGTFVSNPAVYELVNDYIYAYSDHNHGGTAAFLTSIKPIKVLRELDPKAFKK